MKATDKLARGMGDIVGSTTQSRAGYTHTSRKQHLNPVLGEFAEEQGQDVALPASLLLGPTERLLPNLMGTRQGWGQQMRNGDIGESLPSWYFISAQVP